MHFIPALTLIASVLSLGRAASIPSRTDVCLSELPCDGSMQPSSDASQQVPRMTNGERLARGLAINSPKRRAGTAAQPSAGPMTTARIRVDKADGTGTLGYIAQPQGNTFIQPVAQAVIVTFPTASGLAGSIVNLMIQSPTNFPYLGLIQGRDDTDSNLAPGSFHYVYIGSTNLTPTGSTPMTVGNGYTTASGTSRTSESAVFQINAATMKLTLNWVNEDGSSPNTIPFTQSNALYAGGDPSAFNARYPSTVTQIAFFIEII